MNVATIKYNNKVKCPVCDAEITVTFEPVKEAAKTCKCGCEDEEARAKHIAETLREIIQNAGWDECNDISDGIDKDEDGVIRIYFH